MIDLHLHLDGSLPLRLASELAGKQGLGLSEEELRRALTVPKSCESLNDYLRCFELPVRLLQSGEALFRAAHSLACCLADQGLLYAEIRFAPQLHTERGLTQCQAVEAVRQGMRAALKEKERFSAQLILCCMRGAGDEKNRETVKTAEQFYGDGVCAVDLAGAEALYPTAGYRKLFSCARSLGLPFTIHAGEAAGPQSVWDALSFGAARIGHGVRAVEDPKLLDELVSRKVPLELCYTSNLQTKAAVSPEAFPLREYLRRGVCATVNTDNMTVSDVTLAGEYQKLERLGLTREERKALLNHAAQAAFLPESGKHRLLEEIRRREEGTA